jgi:hypothetical protein
MPRSTPNEDADSIAASSPAPTATNCSPGRSPHRAGEASASLTPSTCTTKGVHAGAPHDARLQPDRACGSRRASSVALHLKDTVQKRNDVLFPRCSAYSMDRLWVSRSHELPTSSRKPRGSTPDPGDVRQLRLSGTDGAPHYPPVEASRRPCRSPRSRRPRRPNVCGDVMRTFAGRSNSRCSRPPELISPPGAEDPILGSAHPEGFANPIKADHARDPAMPAHQRANPHRGPVDRAKCG